MVYDCDIVEAVWARMIYKTARGAVCRYAGNVYNIQGLRSRGYVQATHICSRKSLGINLSNGHLRKRIVALINEGRLNWAHHELTFWIDCEQALDMFEEATAWWQEQGVPDTFNPDKRGYDTVSLPDFERQASELEAILVAKYGNLQLRELKYVA